MLRIAAAALVIAMVAVAVGCGGGLGSPTELSPCSQDCGPPPPLEISVSPVSDTLGPAGIRQFNATLTNAGGSVTWKIEEGSAGGTISSSGLYVAPNTTGTFHVTAIATADGSEATAKLTVVPAGFVPTGDMKATRTRHTATLLPDGRVLIVGGTSGSGVLASAELFDPVSGTFLLATGTMNQPREGHNAVLLPNGKVLITGGDDSTASISSAELFDPTVESFTTAGNMAAARSAATATLLPDGKVLIAGGVDKNGALLDTAELYDPTAGTFSLTGNMHLPRARHTATLLSNGKVLLLGSITDTGNAELFDPASGFFRATGSLMQARAHHTATLLPNGKVLVLGGTQIMPPGGGGAASAPVSVDSAEVYDPADGMFHTAGKLLIARDSHSATLLANGIVLVAGGYSHGFDGDADPEWHTMFVAELFDPATSVSTAAASLETDRAEHVTTMLNNGQVLITGGIAGFQELCCNPKPHIVTLASAEVYK